MKKALKILLGITAVIIVISFLGGNSDNNDEVDPVDDVAAIENAQEEKSINPYEGEKAELYDLIAGIINEGGYLNTTVNEITLNKDMNSGEGGYILLVRGTFDIKNSRENGNDVLRMYSNDLMGTLAKEGVEDIIESAIFWHDDYNDRTVKYSYEYKDGQYEMYDVMGE
ncbi:hypothetical protein Amet_2615 [Alkaliphilus metalliredigens QYMF]|uniref:Uncharacterized protein n=1 Tax=Alkaliphilus metalliredigens (strain QYMF) TaxID=293826 RepID=A6TRE9_ALKMQ|nr:hypothetical protein [Alkaliphilus metalliredigens]ABR48767.1 hypothetical protein Amet_2615 [Alkaliphilus metalliredigens QYMF]